MARKILIYSSRVWWGEVGVGVGWGVGGGGGGGGGWVGGGTVHVFWAILPSILQYLIKIHFP